MTNNTSCIKKETKVNGQKLESHKLQKSGLCCIWRGFQAWDTLQDSSDDSSNYKIENSLERQEQFSGFQDTTHALPYHIHLPACFWCIDPHSRAAKKNTSHGNEVQPQDTTHLIQKTMLPMRKSVPRSSRQSDHTKPSWPWKRDAHWSGMTCLPFIGSGQNF